MLINHLRSAGGGASPAPAGPSPAPLGGRGGQSRAGRAVARTARPMTGGAVGAVEPLALGEPLRGRWERIAEIAIGGWDTAHHGHAMSRHGLAHHPSLRAAATAAAIPAPSAATFPVSSAPAFPRVSGREPPAVGSHSLETGCRRRTAPVPRTKRWQGRLPCHSTRQACDRSCVSSSKNDGFVRLIGDRFGPKVPRAPGRVARGPPSPGSVLPGCPPG